MKLRLRERLERARADARVPQGERERVGAALEMLERASVSTIHALCAQVLQERPLECGVLPGFRMADEAQADGLFAEAWEEWLGERLVDGDDVLLDALDRGIPLEGDGWGERTSLRGLARTLLDQRDLEPVAGGAFGAEAARKGARGEGGPGPRARDRGAGGRHARGPARAARGARRGLALPRRRGSRPCTCWRSSRSRRTSASTRDGLRPRRWPRGAPSRGVDEGGARGVGRRPGRVPPREARPRARRCRRSLRPQEGAAGRARLPGPPGQGARDALRDDATVRAWFRRRFKYLVIDEFQDTDPLQVEIARLSRAIARGRSWSWVTRSSRSTGSGGRRCGSSTSSPGRRRGGRASCTSCRTSARVPPSSAS